MCTGLEDFDFDICSFLSDDFNAISGSPNTDIESAFNSTPSPPTNSTEYHRNLPTLPIPFEFPTPPAWLGAQISRAYMQMPALPTLPNLPIPFWNSGQSQEPDYNQTMDQSMHLNKRRKFENGFFPPESQSPYSGSPTGPRIQKTIRDVLAKPENQFCFTCSAKEPSYLLCPFYVFICPPCACFCNNFSWQVKSLAMTNFSDDEINLLDTLGNGAGRESWLSTWNPQKHSLPSPSDESAVLNFMKLVFVKQEWKRPEKEVPIKREQNWSREENNLRHKKAHSPQVQAPSSRRQTPSQSPTDSVHRIMSPDQAPPVDAIVWKPNATYLLCPRVEQVIPPEHGPWENSNDSEMVMVFLIPPGNGEDDKTLEVTCQVTKVQTVSRSGIENLITTSLGS